MVWAEGEGRGNEGNRAQQGIHIRIERNIVFSTQISQNLWTDMQQTSPHVLYFLNIHL